MNKVLRCIILGVAVTTAMNVQATEIDMDNPASVAHWAQMNDLIRETRQKALTDDVALKKLIRMNYDVNFGSYSSGSLISDMRERASRKDAGEDGISLEREIKVMESMVREGLTALEKNEKEYQSYDDVVSCTLMLGALPDYDILPLLKECLKSKSEGLRRNVLIRYILVKEAESIPFLREAIKDANLTESSRSSIYGRLNSTTINLKDRNKNDDVEKIKAFVQEMRQAENPKEKGEN